MPSVGDVFDWIHNLGVAGYFAVSAVVCVLAAIGCAASEYSEGRHGDPVAIGGIAISSGIVWPLVIAVAVLGMISCAVYMLAGSLGMAAMSLVSGCLRLAKKKAKPSACVEDV